MKLLRIKLLVIAAIMLAASSAFASFSYDVSVDTSTLANNDGYLYFQFAPGDFAQDASVTIRNFNINGGSLFGDPALSGGAAGVLPSVVISNSGGLNDYTHGIHFGNSFAFNVLFDGAAVNAPNGTALGGSSFLLALSANADGSLPLLTGDGTLLTFNLDTFGAGTAAISASEVGAHYNEGGAAPTPVPAAAWLLGSGLMGLVGLRRKGQRQ